MTVTITLLCPASATERTSIRLIVAVYAQVVFQTADSPEFLGAPWLIAGPDLVHSAGQLIPFVPHRILFCFNSFEPFVSWLSRFQVLSARLGNGFYCLSRLCF